MAKKTKKKKTPRKEYRAPKLTAYGKLKDLTAGGTCTNPEPGGGLLKPRP